MLSTLDGHVDHSLFWAILNVLVMNIHVQSFVWT